MESGEFTPTAVTFPNGTHVCEVEIDAETGVTEIVRYSAVEELGRVLNPMLVAGQIHGGVVQGVGQALGEVISARPGVGSDADRILHGLSDASRRRVSRLPPGDARGADRGQSLWAPRAWVRPGQWAPSARR